MKKFLSLLLCVLLVCACFSACSGEKQPSDLPEQSQEQPQEQSQEQTDGSAQKPLRVLLDQAANAPGDALWLSDEDIAEDLLERVKKLGGPTDIEVEIVPDGFMGHKEERQTELTRIRVEIMSGAGPDLFICTSLPPCANNDYPALFQFPEQAMRRGLFLNLDEYIENAQFMEWDKLNSTVMSAGKTESGQYLLPLAYMFPLTYFLSDDVPPYPVSTTWADVASGNDPVLGTSMETISNFWYGTDFLSFTWANLADYDTGKLLLTEEDLLQRAKDARALLENNTTDLPHFRWTMFKDQFAVNTLLTDGVDDNEVYQGITFKDDLTMVPLYCDEGGTVAPVRAYAGINAATERPEDAFFVLDVLLSEDFQRNSDLFLEWENGVMPVCDEITGVMLPGALEGYREARSQITSARIVSPLDTSINFALSEYQWKPDDGEATDGTLEELVSEAYREMKRMLDES